MIKADISRIERALVLLVKNALNKKDRGEIGEIITEGDLKFDHIEWGKLITLAKNQGVSAISLDGFPKEYMHIIPKDIKIRWDKAVEQVEARHHKQIGVLKELLDIFTKNSVYTLIVNNLCIGHTYPQPNHRECADLNIAQPDNWAKGNKTIDNLGINVYTLNSKKSIFSFRGVTVHNHNTNPGKAEKVLVENREINIPNRDFTALFFTRQITENFLDSSLVLRHLADLSLFFEAHSKQINFEQLTRELKREGRLKLIIHLLILSHKLLGFETGLKLLFEQAKAIRYISKSSVYSDFALHPTSEKIRKDLLTNEFVKSNINDLITMTRNQRKTLKAKELIQNKWKFRLIKRTLFCKTLLKTIFK